MTQLEQSSSEEVPEWLTPAPSVSSVPPVTSVPAVIPDAETARRELLLVQYPIVFDRVIERIAAGGLFKTVVEDDIREFEVANFRNWIRQDRAREAILIAAEEARTDVWAGDIIEIADAKDSMEDVQRSKLRVDSRKWLMASHNRRRYGESTKIDLNATVEVKRSREESMQELMKLQEQVVGGVKTGVYSPRSRDDVTDV